MSRRATSLLRYEHRAASSRWRLSRDDRAVALGVAGVLVAALLLLVFLVLPRIAPAGAAAGAGGGAPPGITAPRSGAQVR